MLYGNIDLVNNGSGNGMLPDGTDVDLSSKAMWQSPESNFSSAHESNR